MIASGRLLEGNGFVLRVILDKGMGCVRFRSIISLLALPVGFGVENGLGVAGIDAPGGLTLELFCGFWLEPLDGKIKKDY